jgi:hypothetical protein
MAKQLVVQLDRVLASMGSLHRIGRGDPDEYAIVSIRKLCNRMYAEGYRYATLTRYINMDFTEINPGLGLYDGFKPNNSLYFSELVPDDNGDYVPDWYNYLGYENGCTDGALQSRLDSYLRGNIAFAKVADMRVILNPQSPVLLAYAHTDAVKLGRRRWDNMRTDGVYKGFVIHKQDLAKEGFWDVPTLVVWDPTALTDVVFFKRSETPFTYIDNAIRLHEVQFGNSSNP